MSKRNNLLELWRFMFCMAVLLMHLINSYNQTTGGTTRFFHAGYLGVEFFFIAAGYFIGSYYEKKQAGKSTRECLQSIVSYAWSRLVRLYPLYLLALCLMLIVRTIFVGKSLGYAWTTVKNCFAEFFLLQWTPIGNEVLISSCWFVPAVFFGGLCFVIILAFTGKIGGYVVAPIASFFIYRYYFNLIGKIDVIPAHHGILRGIAGIGFGVFIYFIAKLLCKPIVKYNITRIYSWCAGSISSIIFLGIFIYTNYGRRSKWDFLIIALYGIGILLLMSSQIKLPEKVEKVFHFLGKTTYPIYVLQMPIIETIMHIIKAAI